MTLFHETTSRRLHRSSQNSTFHFQLLSFISPNTSSADDRGTDRRSSRRGLLPGATPTLSIQFNDATTPTARCSPFTTSQTPTCSSTTLLPPRALQQESSSQWSSVNRRPRTVSDFCSRSAAPSATKSNRMPGYAPLLASLSSGEQRFQLPSDQTARKNVKMHPFPSLATVDGRGNSTGAPFNSSLHPDLSNHNACRLPGPRKHSWHPVSASSPSGSDSPPLPQHLPRMSTLSNVAQSAEPSSHIFDDYDLHHTGLHRQESTATVHPTQSPHAERQVRFSGCTMNADNPCETAVRPKPDWVWVTKEKSQFRPLFRVEWEIGGVSYVSIFQRTRVPISNQVPICESNK